MHLYPNLCPLALLLFSDKLSRMRIFGILFLSALCACDSPTSKVEPSTPDLVPLSDIAPTIIQEMRYATQHCFIGRPVKGYNAR